MEIYNYEKTKYSDDSFKIKNKLKRERKKIIYQTLIMSLTF